MKPAATRTLHSSICALTAVLLTPDATLAHHFMDGALPQSFVQGLLSGIGHPLIGVDHAAFIIAAGFALALVKGGMWGITALIAGGLTGAALHLAGLSITGGDVGVALSVVLIGGVVLARQRLGLSWLAGGLAMAGVLHGYAYAETIFGAESSPLIAYLIGFSLAQFGVATAALLWHRRMIATRASWSAPLAAGLGTVVGAIGVVFLIFTITG